MLLHKKLLLMTFGTTLVYAESPAGILNLTYWRQIGHSTTASPPVLPPSSILPTASFHCHFISETKRKCYFSFLLFYSYFTLKLCNLYLCQSESTCQQKVKIKQSLYRSGQFPRVPGGRGFQVS